MHKAIKVFVFCLCLVPACYLFIQLLLNNLGPDPGETLSIESGEWTLRFLLITLTISPFQKITKIKVITRYRRMIGLFTLFYAVCHFFVYLMFILGFRWSSLYQDIIERPYITVGFSAFLILIALGITSPNEMVRKLGKNWKRLHKFIYLAAILGIIHVIWIVRSDARDAVIYGSLVALLLGYRIIQKAYAKQPHLSSSK